MKFFISYCDNDGLRFASSAAITLEANGHQAWYFDRNKTPGIQRIEDITNHIRYWCNKILFLCTDGSALSVGQKKEIGQWDNTDKQLIVISIDGAIVPDVIDPYIYQRMSGFRFKEEFDIFVQNSLEEIDNKFEEWNRKIKVILLHSFRAREITLILMIAYMTLDGYKVIDLISR